MLQLMSKDVPVTVFKCGCVLYFLRSPHMHNGLVSFPWSHSQTVFNSVHAVVTAGHIIAGKTSESTRCISEELHLTARSCSPLSLT